MNAFTLTPDRPADVGFVNLNVVLDADSAADAVAVGSHHSRAQLVQDLEGGFVSGEAKLPLKLHSRKAGRHAGNEISAPKPRRERRSRALHDRPGRQSRVLPACPATQNAGPSGEAVGLTLRLAERADEVFRPPHALQVSSAGGVIRKQFLELRQGLGEWQVLPFKHVGIGRHGSIYLPASVAPVVGGFVRILFGFKHRFGSRAVLLSPVLQGRPPLHAFQPSCVERVEQGIPAISAIFPAGPLAAAFDNSLGLAVKIWIVAKDGDAIAFAAAQVVDEVHDLLIFSWLSFRQWRRLRETNSATLLGERRFVVGHRSAPRVQNVKVFGADTFLGEVVQPSDQYSRIGLERIFDRAGDADGHPAKIRVPRFYKIPRRKPLCGGGPSRSVDHLRSPRFNERILACVAVGVNRIGM